MNVWVTYQPALPILHVVMYWDPMCASVTQDSPEMDLGIVQVGILFTCTTSCYAFSDMNECDLMIDNCATNAVCENLFGNFSCGCNFGYSGDGTECSKLVHNKANRLN